MVTNFLTVYFLCWNLSSFCGFTIVLSCFALLCLGRHCSNFYAKLSRKWRKYCTHVCVPFKCKQFISLFYWQQYILNRFCLYSIHLARRTELIEEFVSRFIVFNFSLFNLCWFSWIVEFPLHKQANKRSIMVSLIYIRNFSVGALSFDYHSWHSGRSFSTQKKSRSCFLIDDSYFSYFRLEIYGIKLEIGGGGHKYWDNS